MKKFLYKILLFSIFPLLTLVAVWGYYIYYHKVVKVSLFSGIAKSKRLIMGDSQMQRIRANAFSEETYNFSNSGEHYYFTYQKLRGVFQQEHSVAEVLLGVSWHNFSQLYQETLDPKKPAGQKSMKRNLYLLNFEDPFFKIKDLLTTQQFKGVFQADWGGADSSSQEFPDSTVIAKCLDMHYQNKEKKALKVDLQKKYLLKIQELCAKEKVDLYFVSTPYHEEYKSAVKKSYIQYFEQVLKELSPQGHFNYLTQRTNPSWMSDGNHLNIKGAKFLSRDISQQLEK